MDRSRQTSPVRNTPLARFPAKKFQDCFCGISCNKVRCLCRRNQPYNPIERVVVTCSGDLVRGFSSSGRRIRDISGFYMCTHRHRFVPSAAVTAAPPEDDSFRNLCAVVFALLGLAWFAAVLIRKEKVSFNSKWKKS